jgi:hypothetical protein
VSDQPIFEAEYVERRSRLTTFFRLILAIPHFIVFCVWGIVAALAVVAAWFAVVFTGRYPRGLYDFQASFQRYATAFYGYVELLTDEYPPFSGDTARYPVRLEVPPPLPEYSRAKAFFRLILAIPVAIIVYAMQIVYQLGALIAWFAIVILGRQPRGLQDMIALGVSYQQRAYCYFALMTESWPPFVDDRTALGSGPAGSSLPPASSTTAAPAAPERPTTAPGDRGGLSGGDPLNP